jgi:hypothetical protein
MPFSYQERATSSVTRACPAIFTPARSRFMITPRGMYRLSGSCIAQGKFAPGQKVAGAADGAPILVEGCHRQQVRDIDVFDEFLGLLGDVEKFGDAIRSDPARRSLRPPPGIGDGGSCRRRWRACAPFGLQAQGLDVMGTGHQVGFRRQLVGRMAPVGVGEGAELPAVDKGLQPLLHLLK